MDMGRLWLVSLTAGCAVAAVCLQTPKDIVASQKYDAGSASIELVGVCKATETEAICWGPSGAPDAELEAQFRAGFTASEHRNLPLRVGSKTRVAVFKITNPGYSERAEGAIDTHFSSTFGGYFDWPNRGVSSSGSEPRVEYKAAVIMADPSETVGQVSTYIRRQEKPSARMPVREGARIDYLGTTYTIRKIVKTQLDPLVYAAQGANRWVIAMTAETKEGAYRGQGGWAAIDDSGLVVRAVDKDSNPVLVDPQTMVNLQQQQFPGRGAPVSTPKVFSAQFMPSQQYGGQIGDDYPIYTNINPAKIKEIFVFGSSAQRLVITDIPLEPRG